MYVEAHRYIWVCTHVYESQKTTLGALDTWVVFWFLVFDLKKISHWPRTLQVGEAGWLANLRNLKLVSNFPSTEVLNTGATPGFI